MCEKKRIAEEILFSCEITVSLPRGGMIVSRIRTAEKGKEKVSAVSDLTSGRLWAT